jgi:hypothetical protein
VGWAADQAENQSSKEASCSQPCLAFLVIDFTFFAFRRTLFTPAKEQNIMSRLGSLLRDCKVPRDGMRRYLYDIWQPLALLVITVSFTAVFFTKYDPYSSTPSRYDRFFCNADGTLERVDAFYRPFWDPQLYFSINIPFGRFPFSRAKVIDAAWDAVVGRGGQFVAAVLAYRTVRRSLTLTMETCSVPIPAVASLYCG